MSFQIIKDFRCYRISENTTKNIELENVKFENNLQLENQLENVKFENNLQLENQLETVKFENNLPLENQLETVKFETINNIVLYDKEIIQKKTNLGFYNCAYGLTKLNIPTFVFIESEYSELNKTKKWGYSFDKINWNSFSELNDISGHSYQPYYVIFNNTDKIFICVCAEEQNISFLKSEDGISWELLSTINSEFNFGIPLSWSPELKQYLFVIGHLKPPFRKVFKSYDCVEWNEILSYKDIHMGCNNFILDLPWSPKLGVFLIAPYQREYCYLTEDGTEWEQICYPGIIRNSKSKWCEKNEAFIIENDNNKSEVSEILIKDLENWIAVRKN